MFKARGDVVLKDGKYVPKLDAAGNPVPDGEGIGLLAGFDEVGKIPNQFRGVDNGLTVKGKAHTLDFKLDYIDEATGKSVSAAEADYVSLLQESPKTGKLVKITGDDDGIFIGLMNGLGLPKNHINAAYKSLMDVFNHPFSDTWLAKIDKRLKIFSKYMTEVPGTSIEGKPLIAFVNGEAWSVKINPWLTRFDLDANRSFIAWEGMPAAIDPIHPATSFVNTLLQPVSHHGPGPPRCSRFFLRERNAADTSAPPIPTAKSRRHPHRPDDGQAPELDPNDRLAGRSRRASRSSERHTRGRAADAGVGRYQTRRCRSADPVAGLAEHGG